MTNPSSSDDDWNDLARELGVSKSAPQPDSHPADMVERQIEAEAVEPHHGDPRAEEDASPEGEPEIVADEEFEGEEEGAAEGDPGAEGAEGDQPGTGRKRRRRRRRRRKGGSASVGTAPTDGTEEELGAETLPESEEPPAELVAEGNEFDTDEDEDEDAEAEPLPLAAEEDTASEVLRDLIANWNVPSWDDIVGGLYRPG
jgi:ribonuclease E